MNIYFVISRDLHSFVRAAEEKFPGAMMQILESHNVFKKTESPGHFTIIRGSVEIMFIRLTWDRCYQGGIDHIVCIEDPKNYLDGRRFLEHIKSKGEIKKMEIWEDPESPEAAKRRVNELAQLGN